MIFWVAYLVFSTVQFSLFSDSPELSNVIMRMLLAVWIDMGATYFTVYILFPRFLYTKKYLEFTVSFIFSAAAFIIMQRVLLYYISYPIFSPQYLTYGFWKINPVYSFFNIYSVTSVFASFKLFRFWYENQKQKEELENQNRISELTMLKAQVSPHFLFNTLNNIDSLIVKDQEAASDSVIKLSEILRYMLYEANTDWVQLDREVFYIQSYISLQKLRIKNKDFVNFNISGETSDIKISPMILVPFVENAFKHGSKSAKGAGIKINLLVADDFINFSVANKVHKTENISKDQTSGIGLKNVRRRLDLIYPGNYTLVAEERNGEFLVDLRVKSMIK